MIKKNSNFNIKSNRKREKAFLYIIIQSIALLSITCAHAVVDITNPTAKRQIERKEQDAFSIIEFDDNSDGIQKAGESFQKDLEIEIYDDFQDVLIQGEILEDEANASNTNIFENDTTDIKQGLDIVILDDEAIDSAALGSENTNDLKDVGEKEELEPQIAESTKTSSDNSMRNLTSSEAQIKILDKFTGKTYPLSINEADAVLFEDDLSIRLDKCWMEPDGNLLRKHTALIEVRDLQSKKPDQISRHWVFSHNVELNTFSTEKYYILLDKCGAKD